MIKIVRSFARGATGVIKLSGRVTNGELELALSPKEIVPALPGGVKDGHGSMVPAGTGQSCSPIQYSAAMYQGWPLKPQAMAVMAL